tara:strand:+ start:3083 stop:3637 length:555 start_codon:yes stop_codon:yes gene_type:complete
MIVSFTGAQSTGKSTLLERCRDDEKFLSYDFEPEVTRWVKKTYGLSINEDGDEFTQLAILNRHMHNYLTYKDKDVVLDRCILDGLVYTQYLYNSGKVSVDVLDYASYLYRTLVDKIDIILYTEPDIPLVDDGERSVNVGFRKDIVDIFEEVLDSAAASTKLVRLKGSVENRMKVIYNEIENYGK